MKPDYHTSGEVIFVAADIHLSPLHPHRSERFYAFLQKTAREGRALYLLGDIFDLWLGDDIGGAFGDEVCDNLRALTNSGVKVYLQRGNRDFLLGESFAKAAGGEFIGDNHLIDGGILLTHGDTLVADIVYGAYRFVVRSALARMLFLLLSAKRRQHIAAKLRAVSSAKHNKSQQAQIKQTAAESMLNRHKCHLLIHGHLHHATDKQWQSNNKTYRRLCLPPWEGGGGGYARIDKDKSGAAVVDLIAL